MDDYITAITADLGGCESLLEKRKETEKQTHSSNDWMLLEGFLLLTFSVPHQFHTQKIRHFQLAPELLSTLSLCMRLPPGLTLTKSGRFSSSPLPGCHGRALPTSPRNNCGQANCKDPAKPLHTEVDEIISDLRWPSPNYGGFLN